MINRASHRIDWSLFAAMLLGFMLGAFPYAKWQIALEGAHAVAGLVKYPESNPFFQYMMKAWHLFHQLGAVLLKLGVSDWTLSWLVSGIGGALFCGGASLLFSALTGSPAAGFAGALLLLGFRSKLVWTTYPIYLFGLSETYGVLGLGACVFTLGLLCAGYARAAVFCLTLIPCIHLTWGAWTIGLALLILLIDPGVRGTLFRRGSSVSFLAGASITATSYCVHFLSLPPPLTVSSALQEEYFRNFIFHWDGHRAPVSLFQHQLLPVWMALTTAAIALLFCRKTLSQTARSVVILQFLTAFLSLALSFWFSIRFIQIQESPWNQIRLGWFDRVFLAAMPTRFTNLSNLTVVIFLTGLTIRFITSIQGAVFGSLFCIYLWRFCGVTPRVGMALLIMAIMLFGIERLRFYGSLSFHRVRWIFPLALGLILIPGLRIIAIPQLETDLNALRSSIPSALKPAESPLTIAAGGNGLLLLSGGTHLTPVVAKRSVLLDPDAIDYVSIMPELGEAVNRIAKAIYGVDLLSLPTELFNSQGKVIRPHGSIREEYFKDLWTTRSLEDWQDIRRKFEVTQILVARDWKLKLPIARAEDSNPLVLYTIPPPEILDR